MNHRAVLAAIALLMCVGGIEPRVAAWSPQVHEAVCAVAYRLLPAADQQELDRLARAYRDPDGGRFEYFTRGCGFPDRARARAREAPAGSAWRDYAKFDDWHFLNLPRSEKTVPATCGNCVLHGIEQHLTQLANHNLRDSVRAEALFFLGHWVGDVHQPLHVSYEDDLGGNRITPIRGGFYDDTHLHGVWDGGIPAGVRGNIGWWVYAGNLRDEITPQLQQQWSAIPRRLWAQESYDITIQPETLYCRVAGNQCARINAVGRTLDANYQKRFGDVVELRLKKAGARLATLLAQALHP